MSALPWALAFGLLAAVAAVTAAHAQLPQTGTTVTGPARSSTPPNGLTPAPVPSVAAPSSTLGDPTTVPERISPSGGMSGAAGPSNSTPFSGTGSGSLPPDSAVNGNRDSVVGGAGSPPNVSR